jgi:hypothetical protein
MSDRCSTDCRSGNRPTAPLDGDGGHTERETVLGGLDAVRVGIIVQAQRTFKVCTSMARISQPRGLLVHQRITPSKAP